MKFAKLVQAAEIDKFFFKMLKRNFDAKSNIVILI